MTDKHQIGSGYNNFLTQFLVFFAIEVFTYISVVVTIIIVYC